MRLACGSGSCSGAWTSSPEAQAERVPDRPLQWPGPTSAAPPSRSRDSRLPRRVLLVALARAHAREDRREVVPARVGLVEARCAERRRQVGRVLTTPSCIHGRFCRLPWACFTSVGEAVHRADWRYCWHRHPSVDGRGWGSACAPGRGRHERPGDDDGHGSLTPRKSLSIRSVSASTSRARAFLLLPKLVSRESWNT